MKDKYVVIIDPGHGGMDPGAIGLNNLIESKLVLELSIIIRDLLTEEINIIPILSRESDTYIALNKRISLIEKFNADIFISIHANGFNDPNVNGCEIYLNKNHNSNKNLASLIQKRIIKYAHINRGIKFNDEFFINQSCIPTCLIEIGFITGNIDNLWFKNKDNLHIFAKAIVNGIKDFIYRDNLNIFYKTIIEIIDLFY